MQPLRIKEWVHVARKKYQGLAAGQTAWPMRQYAENDCIQNCKESRREERKNCRINGCIHVVLLGGGGNGASGLAREHYPFSSILRYL